MLSLDEVSSGLLEVILKGGASTSLITTAYRQYFFYWIMFGQAKLASHTPIKKTLPETGRVGQ